MKSLKGMGALKDLLLTFWDGRTPLFCTMQQPQNHGASEPTILAPNFIATFWSNLLIV